MIKDPNKIYRDWSKVDWSKRDCEIAEILNCSQSTVHYARTRSGIKPPNNSWKRREKKVISN